MVQEIDVERLLRMAHEVREYAYTPYSNFRVGCAVLIEGGEIICGVNIENASYSVTLCAERSAFGQVISRGLAGKIRAVAVVTSCTPPGSPCGMCRQMMCEFLTDDVPIVFGNDHGVQVTTTIRELLPHAFVKDSLTV